MVRKKIEEEAAAYYEANGYISRRVLQLAGRSELANAITKKYGMARLKAKLGIEEKIKISWSVDKIKHEANKVYQEKGDLSWAVLKDDKLWPLFNAIEKKYPGRMIQLKLDLGIENKIMPQLSLNSNFVDQSGENWILLNNLIKKYKLAGSTIKDLLKDVPTISAITSNGMDSKLYNQILAEEILSNFISIPKVDLQSNMYKHPNGNTYMTIRALSAELNEREDYLKKHTKDCEFIPGRSKNNLRTKLFNREEVIKKINALKSPNLIIRTITQDEANQALERLFAE